jgi:hypothetical protein
MKIVISVALWVASASLMAEEGRGGLQNSLDSMQQLRSLIPERNWDQMFNISIHEEAFDKQLAEIPDISFETAPTQGFLLFATTSGEQIRILDLYEQFQFSPYWHIPELLEDLRNVESRGIETGVMQ